MPVLKVNYEYLKKKKIKFPSLSSPGTKPPRNLRKIFQEMSI
jgi:hypothetical protein